MISSSFTSELEHLCSVIAPEVAQPIYVLPHPADLPDVSGNCRAYTFRGINAVIRERLIAEGRWRGPGPSLVLVDEFERDTIGNRKALAGRAIHELCHHLPFTPLKDETRPEARAFHLRQFDALATPITESSLPAWFDHGLQFVRACVHAHFRTVWNRWDLCLELDELVCAGAIYELSPAYDYRRALGDEPAAHIEGTISDVLALPPPKAFSDLFARDTEVSL